MAPKDKKKGAAPGNAQPTHDTTNKPAAPAIDYGEVQGDETEVLKAIYMEDFEEVEIKSAWSKTTDRSFKLRLRAHSDQASLVTLEVQLTATYPRSPPVLSVSGLDQFHERTQKRVQDIVRNRPKALLGEVMVHAIAEEIQEALEDAVIARQTGTLPSLAVMNQQAEEAATALAQQAADAETRRQREADEEEQRVLQQMVDEELKRGKHKPSKATLANQASDTALDQEMLTFDQPATVLVGRRNISFTSVAVLSESTNRHRNDSVKLGRPQIEAENNIPLVTVRQYAIQKKRESIMELERLLEQARKLKHDSILSLLAFRVDRVDATNSRLTLCSQHANRGNLLDFLELGAFHISKARQFTTQLLEGLDYLHHNGVTHGNLTVKTVAIASDPNMSPKLAEFGYSWMIQDESNHKTGKWSAPEGSAVASSVGRKSDVWDLGVVVAQMFVGLNIVQEYSSPQTMLSRVDFSQAFDDLLERFFNTDPKKRPSAFDLLPAEFLRTDSAVLDTGTLIAPPRPPLRASSGGMSPAIRQSRHNSSNLLEPLSRYASDFTEIGRLGKGAFGEVVKARNKLDGGLYAVKKIKQTQQLLDKVLSEVILLNRLNHPYVVRYFSTWLEQDLNGTILEEPASASNTDETIETDETGDTGESTNDSHIEFGFESTGGLDFVSSSGYPQIEFGMESDDEHSDDSTAEDEDGPRNVDESAIESAENSSMGFRLTKPRSQSRLLSILYIQMELCERQTLRDLIRRGMSADDAWRFARQITEGLAHIHSHGIIHRDLKPDNIFIDLAGNPKIGDFGLATTSEYQAAGLLTPTSNASGGDMTRSVGTALYVAPELRSSSNGLYSDKVDMYSLGIIFFEMCEPFGTAMERIRSIQDIREKEHNLPAKFRADGEQAAQGKLIDCLISHKPSERPSSTELLRSDVLPLKIEDETIRQALSGLSDPRSPYHQKMMSALFAHDGASTQRVKALAWDAKGQTNAEDGQRLRFRGLAKKTLENIFRRHGAEESRRESVFPRSTLYTNTNVLQLLDGSGHLLQLPYDLVLPHARQLSRQVPELKKSFYFGTAYRDAFTGGPPRVNDEVDFDIVNAGLDDERAFDDAEVMKVADEVLNELPFFSSTQTMFLHVNHAKILEAILEHCRVQTAQQPTVKETISRLGIHQWVWTKIRTELRKFGLSDTTLDDLSQFDFRDAPDKAFERLRSIFESAASTLRAKLEGGIRELEQSLSIATQLGLRRRVYVAPLGSVNAKFYEDGLLFQCILERKSNRTVIAAGGRYDSLIQAHRPVDGRLGCNGAVGISIGLDAIITMMKSTSDHTKGNFVKAKSQNKVEAPPRRCDVLVVPASTEGARTAAIKILSTLWNSDIGAELAGGTRIADEADYAFTVSVRHEASTTVRFNNNVTPDTEGTDIPISSLITHIQQELRDLESTKARHPTFARHNSQQDVDRKTNVHVLTAQHRGKKANKFSIVNGAQSAWSEQLDELKDAPILAVETRDDILDLVSETRLSDMESWRRVVQNVPLTERQYLGQMQEVLGVWRKNWAEGNGKREACVFNFRTGRAVYYDLGH